MDVLVIYSNPPGHSRLRLDREDRAITAVARRYPSANIERQHASDIADVYALMQTRRFDIVQFSGHGSEGGIVLEKADLSPDGELVSAPRLRRLLSLAEQAPKLVMILACYSQESLPLLTDVAPFVITALGPVQDDACVAFVEALYERCFQGAGFENAFRHAKAFLDAKQLESSPFRFDRRCVHKFRGSRLVESLPGDARDSIMVNIDAVYLSLEELHLTEEEFCHLLRRKLNIHFWIFETPRDRCLIPIGRLLFGEFSWVDWSDVVFCTRLVRLAGEVSQTHWAAWSSLLVSYNDLASHEYRRLARPANPEHRTTLASALRVFQLNIERNLKPNRSVIEKLGFANILPHLELVVSHVQQAADQLELERYPQVVTSLEQGLTNYHELVDALQPPEK